VLAKSLRVTFYYVLLAVPISQALALAIAVLMNLKVRGITIFRTIYFVPYVVSGVALAVLWRQIFNNDYGLMNAGLRHALGVVGTTPPDWFGHDAKWWAIPAFVIMGLWGVGGGMIIYLAALKGIPVSLYEAATIDGASALRKFWNVTLPMVSPFIFYNVVMGIIGSFQIFTQAQVMTGGGPENWTLFYVLKPLPPGVRIPPDGLRERAGVAAVRDHPRADDPDLPRVEEPGLLRGTQDVTTARPISASGPPRNPVPASAAGRWCRIGSRDSARPDRSRGADDARLHDPGRRLDRVPRAVLFRRQRVAEDRRGRAGGGFRFAGGIRRPAAALAELPARALARQDELLAGACRTPSSSRRSRSSARSSRAAWSASASRASNSAADRSSSWSCSAP
jgi:ABC-type glycerol-3-phosphate transport system permease component